MRQIHSSQQLEDSLGTHAGVEVVAELFQRFKVLLVVQQLTLFKGGHARLDNNVALEIEYAFDITQGHVQQQADTGRQGLQEPDVSHRRRQFNVTHALTTDLGQRDFNATLFTDHTAVLEALVLAAQALVVLHRAKDLGTEQAVTLRLKGTVVDGFRLFNFAVGPGPDHLRGCQADSNGIELFNLSLGLEQVQ